MKKHFLLVFIAASLFSCSYHTGSLTTQNPYLDKNFEFVDMAVGYSKASYFLGIGGLKKDALVNDAKRNLYMSYPLLPNQTFQNLTLDFKTTYIWPYKKNEAFIVADVVEYDTSINISFNPQYKSFIKQKDLDTLKGFQLYEDIYVYQDFYAAPGKIIKFKKNKAETFCIDSKGNIQFDNSKFDNIFKKENFEIISKGHILKIGDKVSFTSNAPGSETYYGEGKILGLNERYALIRNNRNKTFKVKKGEINFPD
jgi:hypothetical protein